MFDKVPTSNLVSNLRYVNNKVKINGIVKKKNFIKHITIKVT